MIAKTWSRQTALAVGILIACGVSGALAQDDVVAQRGGQEQSGSAASQAKSDLDISALRVDVDQTPRPTLTSTRGIVLPKILGSYR
jgi:hypothetical protein